jgi:hypothetical protein
LERVAPPPYVFIAGLIVVPAFLLQANLEIKAVQVGLFLFVVLITGVSPGLRILWTTLILLGSTVVFNLLTPFGEVLWKSGPILITSGALSAGLFKGLTLVGLMLLSRLAVRRTVVLPGRLGLYISTTVLYLNRMLDVRMPLKGKGLLARLDDLFLSVYHQDQPAIPRLRRQPAISGVLVVLVFVVGNWALIFFLP